MLEPAAEATVAPAKERKGIAIEETLAVLGQLIDEGKVLYWGTSEWSGQQITEAHLVARRDGLTPPTMEQPQYNLFERDKVERDYASIYDSYGLGTTIWRSNRPGRSKAGSRLRSQ